MEEDNNESDENNVNNYEEKSEVRGQIQNENEIEAGDEVIFEQYVNVVDHSYRSV